MTGTVMPLQRASRYPLRSQDLGTNDTRFALHKSSRFPHHPYLKGDTEVMPSLTGSTITTIPDVRHVGNTYSEFGATPPMTAIQQWEVFQDIASLCHQPYNYQIGPEHDNSNYQSTCGPAHGKTMGSSLWDNSFPLDSTLAYSPSPLTCPRSHSQDIHAAFRHAMASDDNAYPTWPYFLDASNSQPVPTAPRCRQFQNNLLPISKFDASRSHLPDESFQNYSPVASPSPLPSTRPDICSAISPDTEEGYEGANHVAVMNGDETDVDGGVSCEPYAQLIYRALKSAPEHKMVLREIYDWFEKNTDKAIANESKGWQNSIRHNLSMNGAFKKVDQLPPTDEAKKGFIWVLEPSALEEGVKSTTRYRRNVPNKKVGKSDHPAPQRQRSGAKGGKAAKKAAKLRRSARFDESKNPRYVDRTVVDAKPTLVARDSSLSAPDTASYHSGDWPYHLPISNTAIQSSELYGTPYGYEDIVGCTDGLPSDSLFFNALDQGDMATVPSHSFCDSIDSLDGCDYNC